MLCCNITDQLLNQYGFAYAGAAEQTGLTTLLIGAKQVNDFNTGFQHFRFCRLILKFRCAAVNRLKADALRHRFFVNRLTQYVEHASQSIFSHRNTDRSAGCDCFHSSAQTVCRTHGNTSYRIVSQMLGNFGNQLAAVLTLNPDRLIDQRKLTRLEANIQYGTDDLGDLTNILFCHLVSPLFYNEIRFSCMPMISHWHLQ